MDTDVIDNREQRLAERVGQLLHGASSARFAVGYLFLDGLAPLRAHIEQVTTLEFLIGNVINRLTEEQVREGIEARTRGGEAWVREQADVAATLRASHDLAAAETLLNLRRTLDDLPRTPEMHALLLSLARRIADGGLKVRLYTRGRIHAKLALVEYAGDGGEGGATPEPTHVAVVGSSNLTLGAAAHPTELNVIVRDPESVRALMQWYQGLWDGSQDFHRELFDELCRSWALGSACPV